MIFGTVPTLSILFMFITLIIAVGLPAALLIVWLIRTKANILSALIGAGTFVVFALILESIMHQIVFKFTGTTITGNIWLYGLYGGLAAGIFEETGRLVVMKTLMKKSLDKENAIMYGIGHGGIEAILIVGLSYISNIATSISINSGAIDDILASLPDDVAQVTFDQISQLWTLTPSVFLMAGVERIAAVSIHLVFSYMVFLAVKQKKISWYFMAIASHAFVDAFTVIFNNYVNNIWMLEGALYIISIALCIWMILNYQKTPVEESPLQVD